MWTFLILTFLFCLFRYVNKIENNILWQGTKRNWHMYTIRNMKAVSCIQNTIFLSCLLYFSFCLTHHIKDMTKHKKKTSSRVNTIKGKHRPYAWKCWLCITLVMDTQSEKNEFHLKYKMITNHIERWCVLIGTRDSSKSCNNFKIYNDKILIIA